MPLPDDELDKLREGFREPEEKKTGDAPRPASAPSNNGGKWERLFGPIKEGEVWYTEPGTGYQIAGRDNALTSLVGFMRAKSIPYDSGVGLAQWWNENYCLPPLDEDILHEKLGRLWVEWDEGGMEDDLPINAGAAEAWEILTSDDLLLMAAQDADIPWLVPNILADKGLHFISAPAAGGKSWVMLDLARCVVSGAKWFDKFPVNQGAVLYIDEEMGKEKTKARVKKLSFPGAMPFFYMGKQGIQLNKTEDVKRICRFIRDNKIRLVCVDTLTGCRPGLMENESSHVSQLRAVFGDMNRAGATVLVAHHDRKAGVVEGDAQHYRMAGSRDFGAMADMAYGLEKKGDYYHLIVTKNRLLSDDDCLSIDFAIRDNDERTATTLAPIDAHERSEMQKARVAELIVSLLGEKGECNTRSIYEAIPGRNTTVLAVLHEMEQEGKIVAEKRGRETIYSLPILGG